MFTTAVFTLIDMLVMMVAFSFVGWIARMAYDLEKQDKLTRGGRGRSKWE